MECYMLNAVLCCLSQRDFNLSSLNIYVNGICLKLMLISTFLKNRDCFSTFLCVKPKETTYAVS